MAAPLSGGVLALDLAGVVGWAYGTIEARDPIFGCWHLPKGLGEGARYVAFENELASAIIRLAPARLVLEASFSLAAFAASSNIQVTRQQLTLRGIAYAEAYRASIPIEEVSADMVRFAVLGQSHFAKGTVKTEIMSYCRGRGWQVPDHNAGDACLTWSWHTTQLRGGRPVAGRLFAERAS